MPQPLAYLIDDVARRHGQLRVGAASAYVRCDDDALLDEILADKRSAGPAAAPPRADRAGRPGRPGGPARRACARWASRPAAESAEGDVLITRAARPPHPAAHRPRRRSRTARRCPTPPCWAPRSAPSGPATWPPRPRARTGPDAGAAAGGELPRTSSAETLATMQAAVMTGEALWIGYVNAEGAASQRVIAPVRVEGGFVTAYDHTADEVRTYPLHRITGELAELGRSSAGTTSRDHPSPAEGTLDVWPSASAPG